MLKDQTMLKQMPLVGKKNCKEVIKYQELYLKKVVMKRLGTIIYSY